MKSEMTGRTYAFTANKMENIATIVCKQVTLRKKGKTMSDEYIRKKDVVDLGVMMQTHLWTREQTYNAIFCLPIADVAPVVRCEDCKFGELFQNDSSGVMARYCKAFTLKRMVADDDYCSYGERKDDDTD